MSEKKDNKKRNTGIALALWILVALILLIVFLVEQDKIFSNLKQTDFFGKVFGKTPTFIENHEVKEEPSKDKNDVAPVNIEIVQESDNDGEITVPVTPDVPVVTEEKKNTSVTAENKKTEEQTEKTAQTKTETKTQTQTAKTSETKPVVKEMSINLCFIEVGSDGSVSEKVVVRKMPKSDSPLVDSINALIAGPNAAEAKAGCKSFIPAKSKLLGASIKNGVARLNFSEDFEIGQTVGAEGYVAQLKQVIYTATAFQTVDSVQFLIDGEIRQYINGEPIWIGSPLSRSSF